jgi:hypothetical protein
MNTDVWMVVAFVSVALGVTGYLITIVGRRRALERRLAQVRAHAASDGPGPE